MNDHKYSKWNRKGYTNKHGWMVRNIPFYTLFEAEHYCTVHNLDPDVLIEYDPFKARSNAVILLDEYERLESVFVSGLEEQRVILERLKKKVDLEGKKDLLEQVEAEVAKEYLIEAVGNYSGRSAFYGVIGKRKLTLINLVHMRIEVKNEG